MINKSTAKSFVLVVISNLVKLVSSFASIFILPLIFTKQDYGFYKLFILYVSYIGLFHFGFIDGIYLKFGGKDLEELPKGNFRVYSKFMFVFQLIVSMIGICLSFFMNGDRQQIFMLVSLNLFAQNLTSYFQFISQITSRFKEFAIRNVIYTVLNLGVILSFYIFGVSEYIIFLAITVLVNYILLCWYLYTYRDLVFGERSDLNNKSDLIGLFKLGIPLLISNLVVTFMNTLPRQFVELMYPVEQFENEFSNFSFAFTLMGFTSVFLTAIGLVIYPILKKSTKETLRENYKKLQRFLSVFLFIAFAAYFPLDYIVQRFIPHYIESIRIFLIMVPSIVFTSLVTVINHNYFKTLNYNKQFLIVGLIGIIELVGIISFSYFNLSRSLLSISWSTLVGIVIWYLMSEIYLSKRLNVNNFKNIAYLFISSLIFYAIALNFNWISGLFLYITVIVSFSILYFLKDFKQLISVVCKRLKKNE
ncbi:hypothetical protein [Acholeplasma hippikon]|uniref:Polysaccharide biosynthesis protein n=1 Tax=Acholeplasma hippikon TaxID=264636 RepID=A0A449BLI2_9MOLU|nr:hypothetical protein [Acholeplasma hippikon]VEU83291.1 Polysaccharide biosynthesis protein [Acholeplasma hippikon]